jgi:ABC-type dipeptide/oligopeptide/nickel transport system permease component
MNETLLRGVLSEIINSDILYFLYVLLGVVASAIFGIWAAIYDNRQKENEEKK